jgi:hypothetical protein
MRGETIRLGVCQVHPSAAFANRTCSHSGVPGVLCHFTGTDPIGALKTSAPLQGIVPGLLTLAT